MPSGSASKVLVSHLIWNNKSSSSALEMNKILAQMATKMKTLRVLMFATGMTTP